MLVLELVALVFEYAGRNLSCSLSSFLAGKAGKTGWDDFVVEDMLAGKDRSTDIFNRNIINYQKMQNKKI